MAIDFMARCDVVQACGGSGLGHAAVPQLLHEARHCSSGVCRVGDFGQSKSHTGTMRSLSAICSGLEVARDHKLAQEHAWEQHWLNWGVHRVYKGIMEKKMELPFRA